MLAMVNAYQTDLVLCTARYGDIEHLHSQLHEFQLTSTAKHHVPNRPPRLPQAGRDRPRDHNKGQASRSGSLLSTLARWSRHHLREHGRDDGSDLRVCVIVPYLDHTRLMICTNACAASMDFPITTMMRNIPTWAARKFRTRCWITSKRQVSMPRA